MMLIHTLYMIAAPTALIVFYLMGRVQARENANKPDNLDTTAPLGQYNIF